MPPFARLALGVALLSALQPFYVQASSPALHAQKDSDGDGLSNELEQKLLVQFAPAFLVGRTECSGLPASFVAATRTPEVMAEDGTIYGQAFPAKLPDSSGQTVELHYYHLWKQDCGAHGHPLDAEHVSVLVHSSGAQIPLAQWKATYWYAAAHENTVCDVSQISRASTLKAEDHGASIWISPGKHASFLNQALCGRGCGADLCEEMRPLATVRMINLGEVGQPMNGALWVSSPRWPLAAEMAESDFPAAPLARLRTLPSADIAWFHPGRHPAQGVISISASTADALGSSGEDTIKAVSLANGSTGNALAKSYHKTAGAVENSARHVGHALHPYSRLEPE